MIVITAFFLNVWANHTETFFLQAWHHCKNSVWFLVRRVWHSQNSDIVTLNQQAERYLFCKNPKCPDNIARKLLLATWMACSCACHLWLCFPTSWWWWSACTDDGLLRQHWGSMEPKQDFPWNGSSGWMGSWAGQSKWQPNHFLFWQPKIAGTLSLTRLSIRWGLRWMIRVRAWVCRGLRV